MKHWTNELGECGTMDDGAALPYGFKITTKTIYDKYVSSCITLNPDPKLSDLEKLIKWAENKGFKR